VVVDLWTDTGGMHFREADLREIGEAVRDLGDALAIEQPRPMVSERDVAMIRDAVREEIERVMPPPSVRVDIREQTEEAAVAREIGGVSFTTDGTFILAELDAAREEILRLRAELHFVRQTVHQAHHEGPVESCPKNTCDAVAKALGCWRERR
jgi:hypothetical protein